MLSIEGEGLIRVLTISLVLAVAGVASGSASASTVNEARREVDRLWGSNARTMRCVITHESHWRAGAINWRDNHSTGPGSFGLAQIGRDWITQWFGVNGWRRALDPVVNVRLAHKVWLVQGFQAWAGYRYCR